MTAPIPAGPVIDFCPCDCATRLAEVTAKLIETKRALDISRDVAAKFQRENEKLIGERIDRLSEIETLARDNREHGRHPAWKPTGPRGMTGEGR